MGAGLQSGCHPCNRSRPSVELWRSFAALSSRNSSDGLPGWSQHQRHTRRSAGRLLLPVQHTPKVTQAMLCVICCAKLESVAVISRANERPPRGKQRSPKQQLVRRGTSGARRRAAPVL